MTPGTYILPRDRDAYSTIRGYVYQVDLTLRRWLDLSESQHLELERGEDIDLVNRALNAPNTAEASRLLEQIKHREQNLTLRGPAALEALANAVEHLTTNSGLDLRFCYTTNATIATERPCSFPRGTAGVALWEQVRQGQLTGPALAEATTALARFLSQAARPDGLDEGVWTQFQQVVAAADLTGFSALVSRFEWSTSATSARTITPEILGLLTRRSLASDAAEAEQLYERLFLFAFKRLCEPGVKRLTRPELQQQLSAATLSATDHATLARLTQCFAVVRLKVDQLEAALSSVSNEVRQLAHTQGIHATLLRGTLTIDLAPPPGLARHSQRAEVVRRLAEHLGSSVWTALTGASDTGKSQLAILLIARVGNLAGWVRFGHDMESPAACATLDSAIDSMCGEGRPEAETGWYLRVCQRIGCGKVIVLDDLPRMNGTDPLAQRLLLLTIACKRAGVRIVSTSHFQPPNRLISSLDESEFAVVPVPMLIEDEVRETLTAYEAPEPLLTRGAARLIHISTGGHPLLVSLAADYLRERGWRFSIQEIEGLLRGEHTESITDELLHRIMSNLADQQRELLYRLTLSTNAFAFDVLEALAEVAPAVDRPREQLNRLLGAWVQRDGERSFIVSPLVRRIGSDNLGSATKIGCYLCLGNLIVRKPMDVYQAQQAILYFCQAEAFNRAGSLLLFLLDRARTLDAGPDIGLLDAMWAESPLPDGMDLNIRLMLRGLQLALLPKYNRRIDFVLADLDRLMDVATEDHALAVTGVAGFAAVHLAERDPDRTLRYIGRAFSPSVTQQTRCEHASLRETRTADEVLWLVSRQLTTPARLDAWLSIVERLPAERRQRLLSGEDAVVCCEALASCLRLTEMAKPEAQRHWASVLAAVDDLRIRARNMGSVILEAAAIRTLLAIHGEHLRQLENAVPTATEALNRLHANPRAVFIVAGMLGQQYAFAGSHAEARSMLEMAISQPAGETTYERMMVLLAASQCFGAIDVDQSIEYAQKAVQIARSEESIPAIEAARAGAELTSAMFLRTPTSQGATGAFAIWSEAAERLFEGRDDSDRWKDLFVIFAHQTSFLTSMATRGRPPDSTESGEEFTAPVRGVFLRTAPARVALYRPSAVRVVIWMLSQYAAAAGDDQVAARWLHQVPSLTDPSRLCTTESVICRDMIPGLITSDRYAEAIDAGLRFWHAIHVFSRSEMEDVIDGSVDLAASWRDLPVADREMIEEQTARLAVLPAACWVGQRILESVNEGITQGQLLASACRQAGSAASDPVLWAALADTVDRIFQEQASGREVIDLGNSYRDGRHHVVAILAYMGAPLHGAPSDAFNAQLAVMQTLFGLFPPDTVTHRTLLLPFIERFWTSKLRRVRFEFSSPSIVENSLTEACQVPAEHRIKAILRAISFGVTSRMDATAKAWLNADD
jgi:hypothetical protein